MSNKPKILFIGGHGGPSGVPSYLNVLCRVLAADYDIVVCSEENRGGYDFVADQGHKHVAISGISRSIDLLKLRAAKRSLSRVIEDEKPDLVWAHSRIAVLVSRFLYANNPSNYPPLAVTFHGLPFEPGHHPIFRALSRFIERALMKKSGPYTLHFLSEIQRTRFAQVVGQNIFERHKNLVLGSTSYIDMPFDRDAESIPLPENAPFKFVMTTRVSRQKNLLAAAAILKEFEAPWSLDICGSGTDRDAFQRDFKARLAGAKYSGDITFHGPMRDVKALLLSSDCYLLTSLYEGMSVGIHEAAQAGLALALSDIEANKPFLKHIPNAVEFDVSDTHGAAHKIMSLRESLLKNSQFRVQNEKAWHQYFGTKLWETRVKQTVYRMLESIL